MDVTNQICHFLPPSVSALYIRFVYGRLDVPINGFPEFPHNFHIDWQILNNINDIDQPSISLFGV